MFFFLSFIFKSIKSFENDKLLGNKQHFPIESRDIYPLTLEKIVDFN